MRSTSSPAAVARLLVASLLTSLALALISPTASAQSESNPPADKISTEITQLADTIADFLDAKFTKSVAEISIKSPQGARTVAKGLTTALRTKLQDQDVETNDGSHTLAGEVQFAPQPDGTCVMVLTLSLVDRQQNPVINIRGRRVALDSFEVASRFAANQLK